MNYVFFCSADRYFNVCVSVVCIIRVCMNAEMNFKVVIHGDYILAHLSVQAGKMLGNFYIKYSLWVQVLNELQTQYRNYHLAIYYSCEW